MNWLFSFNWVLVASIWYLGNGLLHDIFVLLNHKGKYDRELLRLLMDGHVLLLSGALCGVCYFMFLNKVPYTGILVAIIAIAMLCYCAMIFPFLKSIGTILISLLLLIVAINAIYLFPESKNGIPK